MGLMKCVPGVLTSDVQDFSYTSMLEVVGSVRLCLVGYILKRV